MRILLLVLAAMLLDGCGYKNQNYFTLSAPYVKLKKEQINCDIGIDEVDVPSYLEKRELAIQKGNHLIHYHAKAKWVGDMDKMIHERLIGVLKRRFEGTNVIAYPWEAEKNPECIVKLRIHHFIKQKEGVLLDASWQISKRSKVYTYRFEVIMPASGQTESIVATMDKVLGKLEEKIAQSLKGMQ